MSSKVNAMQLFCLLLGLVLIADHATTALNLTDCFMSSSTEDLDLEKFSGIWWEVARQPSSSDFCTEVNITALNPATTTDNTTVLIATTYSNTVDYPWVNQTMNATLSVNKSELEYGFDFLYWNPPNYTPKTVFKVLAIDYTEYAFVCGYTNSSDNSTSFGILLSRDRTPNTTTLQSWQQNASALYPNFEVDGMTVITQDDTCYAAGANPSSVLSMLCFALSFIIFVYLK
ncbi:uncharacterized protein LOC6647366 [Drosophila willistoni]|uniref:uncharacterized protein LOC6647366 n=1 Tax=Drosophila willistoni TaxID=7260 RepID=UPI001F072D1C|nr:uncharacterized protein LOC6647366 [Drosophila willistoni]